MRQYGERAGPLRTVRPTTQEREPPIAAVTGLANMYQRIPAKVLSAMKQQQPLNYASFVPTTVLALPHLEGATVVPIDRTVLSSCTWKTHRLDLHATLTTALAAIESVNSHTPILAKIQLNFANGMQVTFSRRSNVRDASALVCDRIYDPAASFSSRTRSKVLHARQELQRKLQFVADDKGHLRSRPPSPALGDRPDSTFAPSVLFKTAPVPTTGKPGFVFTPMSYISFEQRPNSTVPGCRPLIRDTNHDAINYRPRVLSRAPTPTLYEPITSRNHVSPQPSRNATPAFRPQTAPLRRNVIV